ncbi:putative transcription factor kapC [Amylocarpus encephaloides]|uniref:Putative transcription factor kapC n=1 Tax=Amylocarpus encephaloides TaxID=45428 RepID=A0A9P8C317_9HELO|nr:putative transcription factor kapC [Amylocarpus encephaloides]
MQSIAPAPIPQMHNQQQQQGGPPHGYSEVPASSSASPHDHNIDPAIGGPQGMMSTGGGDSGDDSLADGRKGGKRELSQSKRAAQNRAAQRAFRQRKEGYIKKLEEQVREMHALEENFKAIQSENYSLREYIIHLQSRLIESQGEYPQPPPNVNLAHPHAHRQDGAPIAAMAGLNASSARNIAVASLNSNKHGQEEHRSYEHKRYKDSAPEEADDNIIRSQLQANADGLPASSM